MRTKAYLTLLLTVVLLFGCVTARDAQRNTAILDRYFEGWANRGETAVADELIATNLVLHSPPAVLHSLDEYKQSMAGFHKAFPDLHFTIEDRIAQGNKVAVRWTWRGTHLGEYQGHAPTGKAVTMTGTSTFRIAGGKIQEIWVNMDKFGLMQQLGWISLSP